MRNSFLLLGYCLIFTLNAFGQTTKISPDLNKYEINENVIIKTKDGAEISALIVRDKKMTNPLPTLLTFTVYARKNDLQKAIESAERGYVGMVAYTRGKRYSSSNFVPYEFDGNDANEVIDWISRQTWSNQKVGMYGGSYSGFTQWAATKRLHPALKTIVPSAAVAPGLDVPMTNNVFMSFTFPWTYYVSNNSFLDDSDYNNFELWNKVNQQWFEKGFAYSQLDSIAGRPKNDIFRTWLKHPLYDSYWQNMIPYKREFENISIPVLTTTGYFDGGQIAALYYLREHYKYQPNANHYLLLGPYGHIGCQGFPDSVYNGYKIDATANIPIHEIIYQWFDYIFKNRAKPAILKDKINYQIMGTNQWKHVSNLSEMTKDSLKLYLSTENKKEALLLITQKPLHQGFVEQTVDFKDRTNTHSYYWARNVNYDTLYHSALMYVSDPLRENLELSGNFTGTMAVEINKKDMDYSIVLFEKTPEGKYTYLSYFMGRASFSANPSEKQLLKPGKKHYLSFKNTYLTSKLLSKGSRIVILVNINKSSSEQINYGTGKDVSLETLKDAGKPLKIKWYNDSFIQIPVNKLP